MSRMARSLAALLLLLTAGAPGLFAQARVRLEDQRESWKRKSDDYLRVQAGINASAARVGKLQNQLDSQSNVLRAAEERQAAAWTPWEKILSRRAVEDAKRQVRASSDELDRERTGADHLRQREGVLRLEMVAVGRALCERLIERADELRFIGRDKQADEYYAEALDVMALVEDLEAAEAPLAPPPPLPELAQETRERTAQQLEELAEFYEGLQAATRAHLEGLRPEEEALTQRLRHLERLAEARVVLPTLPERRERTRQALERVATLRQALELRAARYQERIEALQEVLRARAVEESQRGRAGGEGR